MELIFKVREKSTGEYSDDFDSMMTKSGIDSNMKFEDIGIQSDGTAVIFDKCGNFGYLSDEFELVIMSDA